MSICCCPSPHEGAPAAPFPGPDSPAYRAWSVAVDAVILNASTLAGCLLVVMMGIFLTVYARVAGEMVANDDLAIMNTWWYLFRFSLHQSPAWQPPMFVLVALSVWECLLLSDSSLERNNGRVSGLLFGLVPAGGAFLAAILVQLLPLVAFFNAPVSRHSSNAPRLTVGRLGVIVSAPVIVMVPAIVFWGLAASRAVVVWSAILIGPAFQAYPIALLQCSTMVVPRGASTSES